MELNVKVRNHQRNKIIISKIITNTICYLFDYFNNNIKHVVNYMDSKLVRLSGGARRRKSKVSKTSGKKMSKKSSKKVKKIIRHKSKKNQNIL